ncbi:cytochrome P450 [Ferviditalea candida]|uniref:Cytochrome P450 n=1 Tax=Ferviditalea candida TaxID=3108399 RepID=A0ABU5ZQI7_9BACL|nr:cytochrome P450 [Paenibacillaceae bacterium T2]
MNTLEINLENEAFEQSVPHETFAYLRKESPLHWYDWKQGKGFWCLTRHADITETLKNWRQYSSELGGANLEDLDEEQLAARKSMLETDPPRHTRLRGIVSKWFTPKSVEQYETLVRALTKVILDEAFQHEEFDFVEEIAARLPIQVLARILGVPNEDTSKLIAWGDSMIGNSDPDLTDVVWGTPESEKYRMYPFRSPAALEVFDYGHWMAEKRRQSPEDDLVTKLIHSEIDGERLSEREFDTMFLLLVVAGNETTRQAIAHGLHAFIENPDQIARLQQDPSLMPSAVEEILRWASPVLHFRRTAVTDTELYGKTIHAGDKVVMWFASANRDEAVFEDPFRFDIARSPNPHLAFGQGGPHACLGSYLARLEIKVMFEELLPRLHNLSLNGSPVRMRSNFTNALKQMPVRLSK